MTTNDTNPAGVLSRPLIAVILLASLVVVGHRPSAAAEEEPMFHFTGGGWGHGVGMSQYGALGRAEAGSTHTEILAFYYHGTEVIVAPELVPDDVDVRIAVHNTTTFTPSGMLTVAMDGSLLDTTVNRLRVRRVPGGWQINSSGIDWCQGFCPGTVLTVDFTDGEPVRVSDTDNGPQRYAHGQFQLTPADTGAANCGSGSNDQYCLVVGELSMQQYLYGIAEVPHTWHVEALKVQAIAARSYAIAKMSERAAWNAPFELYSWTKDQTYKAWDKESAALPDRSWPDAVDATDDMVVVYTPEPVDEDDEPAPRVATTFYTTANGGHTAASEESWSRAIPYLVAKPDPYDAALNADGRPKNPFHIWYRSYTYADVSRWLAEYTMADLDVGDIVEIRIDDLGPSGRIDDALVTLVGSERTLEVRKSNGDPYGYRFYYALLKGCERTRGCRPMLSTKITLSGNPEGPVDDTREPPGNSNGDEPDATEFPMTRFNPDAVPPSDHYSVDTLPFTDVSPAAPYAEAITWMLNAGITQGTTATSFSPDTPLTRVQFAVFLWRFAGSPTSDSDVVFTDLDDRSGFIPAVRWMLDSGLTSGCDAADPDRFCPHEPLTAAQVATFLWRFAGRTSSYEVIYFEDVESGGHYVQPTRWMLEWDLWVGDDFIGDSYLSREFKPHQPVPRSRISMYLWNLAAAPGAFTPSTHLPPLMRDIATASPTAATST